MTSSAETASQSSEPSAIDSPPVAIRARDVVKTFTIHSMAATSLKEIVLKGLYDRGETTIYTALDGISFELRPGRSLAIVGSNGSGKSTLLRMISGISQPDSGSLEIHGRVAALLELGAGFHPDLTGMENIFLQGSILGMTRPEIFERLDKILDFCELGEFIHTPLKRYSSGMVVRLGFALAVYSDADTLIIDEVLAVGDAAFQNKCLQKIADMRSSGKTILFVSHAVEHVELVADDMLWIEKGKMIANGPLAEVLPQYLDALSGGPAPETDVEIVEGDPRMVLLLSSAQSGFRLRQRGVGIESVQFLNAKGEPQHMFQAGEPMMVDVVLHAADCIPELDVAIGYSCGEVSVAYQRSSLQNVRLRNVEGRQVVRAVMPNTMFVPGRYKISVGLGNPEKVWDFYDLHMEVYSIRVLGTRTAPDLGTMMSPPGKFVEMKTPPTK